MFLLYFKGPGEPKIDKKSIKNRTWKNTKKSYVQFSKKTKKCDFRVPLGTPKGGQRTNFFSTFSALGAQGGQKAPRCPPRGPRDRPKGSQGSVDELKRCPREPQKCWKRALGRARWREGRRQMDIYSKHIKNILNDINAYKTYIYIYISTYDIYICIIY